MPVSFVGKGLALVAARPSPTNMVTPKAMTASYRITDNAGRYILTESKETLRSQTDG